jgi:hypothetical protein
MGRKPSEVDPKQVESARAAVEAYFDFHRHQQTLTAGKELFQSLKRGLGNPPTPVRSRGRPRGRADWFRDAHIAEAVALVVRMGLPVDHTHRFGGQDERRATASSIVAKELGRCKIANVTAREVAKIWEKFAPSIGLREPSIERRKRQLARRSRS